MAHFLFSAGEGASIRPSKLIMHIATAVLDYCSMMGFTVFSSDLHRQLARVGADDGPGAAAAAAA